VTGSAARASNPLSPFLSDQAIRTDGAAGWGLTREDCPPRLRWGMPETPESPRVEATAEGPSPGQWRMSASASSPAARAHGPPSFCFLQDEGRVGWRRPVISCRPDVGGARHMVTRTRPHPDRGPGPGAPNAACDGL